MLVKTPAIKLAVEIRQVETAAGRIVFKGVANAMPCTVEMTPSELLVLARSALRPAILKLLIGVLFSRHMKEPRDG